MRVSNELGASHPRTAKFSLLVAVITSTLIGVTLSLVLIIFRNEYPFLFSNDSAVREMVVELTPMLAICIVINNVQPVLSGVAVGAGWQAAVAYVNIACYYLFGIPLGLLLGYKLEMGVTVSLLFIITFSLHPSSCSKGFLYGGSFQGIWSGMLSGTVLQTCVLFFMVYRTDWNKEVIHVFLFIVFVSNENQFRDAYD